MQYLVVPVIPAKSQWDEKIPMVRLVVRILSDMRHFFKSLFGVVFSHYTLVGEKKKKRVRSKWVFFGFWALCVLFGGEGV